MERPITNNKAVDNSTIEQLFAFVDSWRGKLTIPPEWIQTNLKDAHTVLNWYCFAVGEDHER